MLGDARDGPRDLAVVVACGLLPVLAMTGLGARALRNEAAATERELAALVVGEGARLGSAVERELRDGDARIRRGEPAHLPFADEVRLDEQGAPARTLGTKTLTPLAPVSPACDALATQLRSGGASARDGAAARLLAECPLARSTRGRFLVPWLLVERRDAATLSSWLKDNGAHLEANERASLRTAVVAEGLPIEAERLGPGAETEDETARLLSTESVRALPRQGSPRGEISTIATGPLFARFVRYLDSGYIGYAVTSTTLARAVANGTFPVAKDLAVGLQQPPYGPASVIAVGGDLRLYVTLAGPEVLARQTRESRLLLGLSGAGALVTGGGFLLVLLRRIREARRTSELRTDFVATVSHELRTPAASLQMLAELSVTSELSGAEREEVGAALVKETRRLSATVERLLSLRRIMAQRLRVDRAETDVALVLRAAADEAELPALRRDYPASLSFSVDAAALRLAIDNLLANAKKHAVPPFVLRAEVTASALCIEVSDAGPGIAPADVRRLFEPFERARDRLSEATEGTGIGLALVRGVARAHGGDVTCTSDPGAGTRFRLSIPREKRR